MPSYVWFQHDPKSENHFLKLGEAVVGYLAKTKGKSGRYLSAIFTPIDSRRAELYYSGKDLERAKRLTEARVTEFLIDSGLMMRPTGPAIAPPDAKKLTVLENHRQLQKIADVDRQLQEIADVVIPSSRRRMFALPQDETKNTVPLEVWVKAFQLMKEHPDAQIVAEDEHGNYAPLYQVHWNERGHTIEFSFDWNHDYE